MNMKIIDISREIFTSPCYADDPQPHYRWHKSIYAGDDYNLSVLSMTPHAGTHIDAPLHFIKHGKSVEECTLEKCFGSCTVITISGVLTGEDMDRLLPHCAKRLLIHGNGDAVLELSAARVITENNLLLIGTDALSISFDKQEEAVQGQSFCRFENQRFGGANCRDAGRKGIRNGSVEAAIGRCRCASDRN